MSILSAIKLVDKKFWCILAFAAALIFFRITHVDMTGDDAVYAVRSIGLLDFMFGDASFQPTPHFWYRTLPWWTRLSWHDHPKLLFTIGHVFLSIRESIFFAKLPYALFVLGAISLTYATVVKYVSKPAGLLAALLLALNAHVIWAGRVTYMEGGVIFFIALVYYFLFAFLHDKKYWWQLGVALGLALSAKLTTVFLIPTILAVILLRRRELFRRKELYGAFAIAVICTVPWLLYNAFMYYDRGHFSLQLVRLLHQKSPWASVGVQALSDPWAGIRTIVQSLGQFISWPYAFGAALGYVYLLSRTVRHNAFPYVAGALLLFLQQLVVGQTGYMLAPFGIFFAPIAAIAYADICERYQQYQKAMSIGAAVFCLYLGFFVANSHSLGRHIGPAGWLVSSATSENFGVLQLDRYLNRLVTSREWGKHDVYRSVKERDSSLKKYKSRLTQAELDRQIQHSTIVLHDGNISWPARLWLFERRLFYHNLPMISTHQQAVLGQLRISSFYFIRATDAAPLDPIAYRKKASADLEATVIGLGVAPEFIYRDDGQVAFKVYYVPEEVFAKAGTI